MEQTFGPAQIQIQANLGSYILSSTGWPTSRDTHDETSFESVYRSSAFLAFSTMKRSLKT
jgi:hypothetical protein